MRRTREGDDGGGDLLEYGAMVACPGPAQHGGAATPDGEAATESPEGWAIWPYRIVVTLTAALLASQPITAGQLMSGSYGSRELHAILGYTAAGSAVFLVLPAVVAVWRRAVSEWHIAATVALSGLAWIQILVGENRSLTLHVPLGVAVVIFGVLQTWSAWKHRSSLETRS